MRILFITRNFPPQVGGLEKVAFYLHSHFIRKVDVVLLKWSGSKKLLFFILPYFLIKSSFILMAGKIDVVYLNEGFLSSLGVFLKIFRKPVMVTIHGLDITYRNKIYQLIIPECIAKMDRVICISRATKNECIKRGIPEEKICVIPDGIKDEFYIREGKRDRLKMDFIKKFNVDIENKKILLSVSRLVRRKGIHWFVKEVLPLLLKEYKDFIYIVVGDGPMRPEIESIIQDKKLERWVVLLGKIDDALLRFIYNIADVFIMPNIPVRGDIEGFGIVTLEAASCKVPVAASNLEGIKDALLDGKAGRLISPLDAEGFKSEILRLLNDDSLRREWGERTRRMVLENFEWRRIIKRYLEVFEEVRNR